MASTEKDQRLCHESSVLLYMGHTLPGPTALSPHLESLLWQPIQIFQNMVQKK